MGGIGMRFDIVTLNSSYKGISRSLTDRDIFEVKGRKHKELLTYYFEYIDLAANHPYDIHTFDKLIEHYLRFREFGVACEVIAYDLKPLKDAFGKQIQLLGIDVVCDMAESLLEVPDTTHDAVKNILNEFGLCKDAADVDIVRHHSDCGDNIWLPCWVYRVNI